MPLPTVLNEGDMEDFNWQLPRNILGKAALPLYFSVWYNGAFYNFDVAKKAAAIAYFASQSDFVGWVSLNGNDYSRLALSQGDIPVNPVTYAPVLVPQAGDNGLVIPTTNPATSDNYYWLSHYAITIEIAIGLLAMSPGFACTVELIWNQSNSGITNNLGSSGIKWAGGVVPTPSPWTSGVVRDLIVLYWDYNGDVIGSYINNFA